MVDRDPIWAFVVLTFALSVPFWALGQALGMELLPGLPLSALMIAAPALSAQALTASEGGRKGGLTFLARAVDIRRASWKSVALALAIMPAATVGAWLWMRACDVEMPEANVTVWELSALFAAFLPAAAAEELGWSGYMACPLRRRWGFLGAAVLIGLICAVWHLPALLQAGRSLDWIAWWALATVAARIVTMAIFEWSNGSVAAVSILHAAQNTAWQAFPVNGSHYDLRFIAPVFAFAAICAVFARFAWPHRQ